MPQSTSNFLFHKTSFLFSTNPARRNKKQPHTHTHTRETKSSSPNVWWATKWFTRADLQRTDVIATYKTRNLGHGRRCENSQRTVSLSPRGHWYVAWYRHSLSAPVFATPTPVKKSSAGKYIGDCGCATDAAAEHTCVCLPVFIHVESALCKWLKELSRASYAFRSLSSLNFDHQKLKAFRVHTSILRAADSGYYASLMHF